MTCLAASLLLTTPGFAAGVDPGQATAVQREQAQSRFSRGKSLYEAGKYDAAATEFQAANDIVASPNARLYYARALREGGHLVQAYEELGRTEVDAREHVKDDARYEKAADTAAAERSALKPRLGFVVVDVQHPTNDTTLTVGGEEIRRAGWTEPAPVKPGTTDVVVESGGKTVRRQVSVRQGHTESMTIDAAADDAVATSATTPSSGAQVSTSDAPTDRTKLRPYVYVAGGVGAAGLVTFVVAGLMANSTYGDLQDKCGTSACPAPLHDEISRGKTEQTIANVGLVVGVLGAGVGATLFVLSMPKKNGTTAATLAPVVGPSFSGIKGTF
ncbi:MAG: tetratricopeptide repeat protein [Polyangiaceae bacterium]